MLLLNLQLVQVKREQTILKETLQFFHQKENLPHLLHYRGKPLSSFHF